MKQEKTPKVLIAAALIAALMLLLPRHTHAAECAAATAVIDCNPPRTGWRQYLTMTCDDVRTYMATHTREEAKAEALAKHIPEWLQRRAEKCIT